MAARVQVTFDCLDPDRLATFWAEALHYKKQDPPAGFASWHDFLASIGVPEEEWNSASAVVDPGSLQPRIYFQQVREPKAVKNRVHLDVSMGGGPEEPPDERRPRVDAEVPRLLALGATLLRPHEERGSTES